MAWPLANTFGVFLLFLLLCFANDSMPLLHSRSLGFGSCIFRVFLSIFGTLVCYGRRIVDGDTRLGWMYI